MMSAWGLLAFLKATDTRENASFAIRRGPGRRLTEEARRRTEPVREDEFRKEEGCHDLYLVFKGDADKQLKQLFVGITFEY